MSFTHSIAEQDSGSRRLTLYNCTLYLDTCATYHSAFVDWMLNNVHEVNTILRVLKRHLPTDLLTMIINQIVPGGSRLML